jgi:hypothetical protein
VLNGSTLSVMHTETLQNPSGRKSDFISVTYDSEGYGILTWMDATWNNYLYYAEVGGNGSLVTPPIAFYKSASSDKLVLTNFRGQGNAYYDPHWFIYLPSVKH